MRVLFLDIDGVLNSQLYSGVYTDQPWNKGWLGIDKKLVVTLNKIMDKNQNVKIVIHSMWRLFYTLDEIKTFLDYASFKYSNNIIDKTEHISGKYKGSEIAKWLDNHDDIENFVILDDAPAEEFKTFIVSPKGFLHEYFCQIDPKIGLVEDYIELVHRTLKGEVTSKIQII